MKLLVAGDCLEVMKTLPDGCASMALTSPPYEDARLYAELKFKVKGQDWVDWCIPRVVEACRVTKGIVFFNAAGKVRQFKYSPVMEWLVADLTRQHGLVCGPAPYVFARVGIAGSGGPHYHRRDWEPVYSFARPENLPPAWSDNTATGHPPKYAPGGAMSHRVSSGARVNQWGHSIDSGATVVDAGGVVRSRGKRPSHKIATGWKGNRRPNGSREEWDYVPPKLANSGNVIKCKVGGGHMGSKLAHENEAPFPESLANFFIRSYCPPDGTALDFCCGSGTVCAVAARLGRGFIGIDARESQIELTKRRLAEVQTEMF